MTRYLLIALGGALGSMLRYFIGATAAEHFGPRFPVGTLSINLSACFLIGLVLQFLGNHSGINPAWRFLIAVGFLGGYSTFSTFEWEVWSDISTGAFWIGMAYTVASIVGGFIAVSLGAATARAAS